jgi:hypothetical protein
MVISKLAIRFAFHVTGNCMHGFSYVAELFERPVQKWQTGSWGGAGGDRLGKAL